MRKIFRYIYKPLAGLLILVECISFCDGSFTDRLNKCIVIHGWDINLCIDGMFLHPILLEHIFTDSFYSMLYDLLFVELLLQLFLCLFNLADNVLISSDLFFAEINLFADEQRTLFFRHPQSSCSYLIWRHRVTAETFKIGQFVIYVINHTGVTFRIQRILSTS